MSERSTPLARWAHDAVTEKGGHAHACIDAYGAKAGIQAFPTS